MLKTKKIKEIIQTVKVLDYTEELVLDNYITAIDNTKNIFQRNVRQTAATLYYMVKRKMKKPVSFGEVNYMFYGRYLDKETRIQRYYKYLIRKLDIKNCKKDSLLSTSCMMQVKPSNIFPNIISRLELTDEEREIVLACCIKYGKKTWKHYDGTGNSVYGYCSGLLYLVGILESVKITQRHAADVCDITELGTRKHFQQISALLDKDTDFIKIKPIIKEHLKHTGGNTKRKWKL